MDKAKRKQMTQEYLNRKPEMGIIEMKCEGSGDIYYNISKDTKADTNSNTFKLKMGSHPNKTLQALWDEQGREAFELSVPMVLKYDDPKADQTEKLMELEEKYLKMNPNAKRIWR